MILNLHSIFAWGVFCASSIHIIKLILPKLLRCHIHLFYTKRYFDKNCKSLETEFLSNWRQNLFGTLLDTNKTGEKMIFSYFFVQFILQLRVPIYLPWLCRLYVHGLKKLKKEGLVILFVLPYERINL